MSKESIPETTRLFFFCDPSQEDVLDFLFSPAPDEESGITIEGSVDDGIAEDVDGIAVEDVDGEDIEGIAIEEGGVLAVSTGVLAV